MEIWLFGEGNSDVTVDDRDETEGAIRILLKRLIEINTPRDTEIRVVGKRLPRLQRGSGFSRKVDLAIALASTADGVAIVIDRDGPKNRNRLALLSQGRTKAQEIGRPQAFRTALGVAIEMLEAWLLADTAALARIVPIDGAAPEPESIADPKREIARLLGQTEHLPTICFDRIAKHADLTAIRRRCPAFDAFASEVNRTLVP